MGLILSHLGYGEVEEVRGGGGGGVGGEGGGTGQGRKSNVTEPWTKKGRLFGQDFHKLRSSHLKSGSLFTDPCFPPNHQSISYTGVLADDAARSSLS